MNAVVSFVDAVNNAIINPVLALLFTAGLIYFFWGGGDIYLQRGQQHEAHRRKESHVLGTSRYGGDGVGLCDPPSRLRTLGVTNANLPQNLPIQI